MTEFEKSAGISLSKRDWLALIPPLLPPLVLVFLLWRDAVNVPYWDEWGNDMAGVLVKSKTGHLTFGDLWAQHNESRFLLLRVVMLLSGGLTHWNLCSEVDLTFLLAAASAVMVYRLGRKTLAGRAGIHGAVFFLVSLLMFSPTQYEIWLWGMEFILLVPFLCLLGCLLSLQSRAFGRWTLVWCAALATVSTYSFSNGLVVWLVLVPVLAWPTEPGCDPDRKKKVIFWLLCFAANVAIYFQNYQFASSGFWQFLLTKPGQVLEFFLAFLGGPLARRGAVTAVGEATVLGLVILALFVFVVVGVFRRRTEELMAGRALPWLTVGGYGILSALLATCGRATSGPAQATAPRYSVFGICLIIALIHLLPVLLLQPGRPLAAGKSRSPIKLVVLPALGVLVIALHLMAFPANVRGMTIFHLELEQAKACLQFLDVLPPQPAMTQCLFPDYPTVKTTADQLERLGIRQDALIQTVRLTDFTIKEQSGCGEIDQEHWDGDDLLISGWAMSSSRHAAADCVLFTCESTNLEPVIFALMDGRFSRPDLVAKLADPALFAAGWLATIRRHDLPPGGQSLKAWSYDAETRQLTPLQGEIPLHHGNN